MKKEFYLHIPEPCHENWDAMNPVEQGRFCTSCNKQVVDFSAMSDKEVLRVLTKTTGNTCGRFNNEQLEKPLVQEVPPLLKPYKFFLAAFIPAFILAGTATAQEMKQGKVAVNQRPAPPPPTIMGGIRYVIPSITGSIALEGGEITTGAVVKIKGTNATTKSDKYGRFKIDYPYDKVKVALAVSMPGYKTKEVEVMRDNMKPLNIKLYKTAKEERYTQGDTLMMVKQHVIVECVVRTIKGKIINELGEPLPNATIKLNETRAILSDSSGRFSLPLNSSITPMQITTSYVGYEEVVTDIQASKMVNDTLLITLKNAVKLGEVVMVSYPQTYCTVTAGAVSIVRRVTYADTIKRYVAKVFKNEMFKVFPNPARRASVMHISFKEQGTYTLQLFDNSGKLYLAKEIKVDAKQASPIELPSNLSSGIYYLKAINSSNRKQYVDKIIIQ